MNLIKRFTKKPVTIEAIQFADDANTISNIHGFMGASGTRIDYKPDENGPVLMIPTLEGVMKAQVGDWIIKGVKGEFYPCKPDIFEKTYSEAAKEQPVEEGWSGILTETRAMAARLNDINSFMASDAFPKLPRPQKDLFYEQQRTMSRLVQILGQQLEFGGITFEHSKP